MTLVTFTPSAFAGVVVDGPRLTASDPHAEVCQGVVLLTAVNDTAAQT